MIDHKVLQKMWEKDSKVDMDNLHQESSNICSLHAKYYEVYNILRIARSKADQQRKIIRKSRYDYFTGKADQEVYNKDPFPRKLKDKETIQNYLDADEALSHASRKVEEYDFMIDYIRDILKMISNRSYHINNSIEFMKFQSGMG